MTNHNIISTKAASVVATMPQQKKRFKRTLCLLQRKQSFMNNAIQMQCKHITYMYKYINLHLKITVQTVSTKEGDTYKLAILLQGLLSIIKLIKQ